MAAADRPDARVTDRMPNGVRFRPRRLRVVAWLSAAVTLLASVALAAALRGTVGHGEAVFGTGDRLALMGLGGFFAGALLLFARPRVEANAQQVRVRNLLGSHELPWAVVRSVRFDRGAPWATLELQDDDVVSVLAVQAVDREHAVTAVRVLRDLHAAATRADSTG